jgi:hypothetical protein
MFYIPYHQLVTSYPKVFFIYFIALEEDHSSVEHSDFIIDKLSIGLQCLTYTSLSISDIV